MSEQDAERLARAVRAAVACGMARTGPGFDALAPVVMADGTVYEVAA